MKTSILTLLAVTLVTIFASACTPSGTPSPVDPSAREYRAR